MQVWQTIREEDLCPYGDQRVLHVEPGDLAHHMDLCYWMTAHPQLLSFIDEASFTWEGISNSQNSHMWSHGNLHEARVTSFQRRFLVNDVICSLAS
jgi:hypothetical protein